MSPQSLVGVLFEGWGPCSKPRLLRGKFGLPEKSTPTRLFGFSYGFPERQRHLPYGFPGFLKNKK
jgi:hypothetical protein